MQALQLDFFAASDTVLVNQRVDKVEKTTERVRKCLFAKNSELKNEFSEIRTEFYDMKERLKILERYICVTQNQENYLCVNVS